MDLEKIKERVRENGGELIYFSLCGSKLFGLDNANSDSDYFGLFVPTLDSIKTKTDIEFMSFNTNGDKTKNTKEDDDISIFSIYKFFNLLKRGDGTATDLLFSMFSDKFLLQTMSSILIKNNYKKLITSKTEAFVGFALAQSNKYTVKGERLIVLDKVIEILKSKEHKKSNLVKDVVDSILTIDSEYVFSIKKEEGVYLSVLNRLFPLGMKKQDLFEKLWSLKILYGNRVNNVVVDGFCFKAFSHSFRAIQEASELLETGFITLPLKDRKFILDVKNGVYKDVNYLSEILEEKLEELALLKEKTKLPSMLQDKDINYLILQIV